MVINHVFSVQFEKGRKFNLKVLNCQPENVYQTLVENLALYHKTCYSKYNQRMLNRLIEKEDDFSKTPPDAVMVMKLMISEH